jgi:hypothetical protein
MFWIASNVLDRVTQGATSFIKHAAISARHTQGSRMVWGDVIESLEMAPPCTWN